MLFTPTVNCTVYTVHVVVCTVQLYCVSSLAPTGPPDTVLISVESLSVTVSRLQCFCVGLILLSHQGEQVRWT